MAATISLGNLRPSSRCVMLRRTCLERRASAGRVRESACLSAGRARESACLSSMVFVQGAEAS